MANSLYEVGGMLTLVLEGNLRFEDMLQVEALLEHYVVDGTIDKLVVDLAGMGYPDMGARHAAMRLAGKFYYNHVALVRNASSLNNALVLFIARQSNHVREIECFPSREDAVAWLQHESSVV